METKCKRGLLILGAGGHGRVVADVATAMQCYGTIAFLDDTQPESVGNHRCLGKCDDAAAFLKDFDFFVAIGNGAVRQQWLERLQNMGARLATLIHPSAVLGSDVCIGEGTVLMPGAIVNAGSRLATGVIVNTAASVDHDCIIGSYSHIAVGAHLCGTVTVGEQTWIGAGATVVNNVEVASFCTVGAGGVVIHSVFEAGTYVGVPVRKVK